jgi:hypothetical protein
MTLSSWTAMLCPCCKHTGPRLTPSLKPPTSTPASGHVLVQSSPAPCSALRRTGLDSSRVVNAGDASPLANHSLVIHQPAPRASSHHRTNHWILPRELSSGLLPLQSIEIPTTLSPRGASAVLETSNRCTLARRYTTTTQPPICRRPKPRLPGAMVAWNHVPDHLNHAILLMLAPTSERWAVRAPLRFHKWGPHSHPFTKAFSVPTSPARSPCHWEAERLVFNRAKFQAFYLRVQ